MSSILTLGMDLGGSKAAISVFYDHSLMEVLSYSVPGTALPRVDVLTALSQLIEDRLVHLDSEEAHVWIEDPLVGRGVQSSLRISECLGMVYTVIGRTHPLWKVETINQAKWKAKVLHNGNAKKSDIKGYVQTHYPSYAELCGSDQDKYDATCIGIYGEIIGEAAQGLQLE